MHLSEIHNKIKGLTDLLYAAAAQAENADSLRLEGVLMLANISSDIEHELEDYINNDLKGEVTQ